MTRYAGDYFGVTLDGSDTTSKLLDYFPGLRKVTTAGAPKPKEESAVTQRGYATPDPFIGFKLFEAPKKKA